MDEVPQAVPGEMSRSPLLWQAVRQGNQSDFDEKETDMDFFGIDLHQTHS